MNDQPYPDAFVTYLEELRDHEDRAALAAMRRWLSQPDIYSEATPYVQRRLSVHATEVEEATYYLIGGLFALHDESAPTGNMGDHFRDMCASMDKSPDDPPPNIERRFMALLVSDNMQIDVALRQAISLLKANGAAVNWHELAKNVKKLKGTSDNARLEVQRKWARSFWGQRFTKKAEQAEPAT